MLAALLLGCTTVGDAELGSAEIPVHCDGKRGELAYLGRLRCPSCAAPNAHFQRRGPRAPDGHETDEFLLRCVLDNRSTRLVFDRHHAGYVESRPVGGFAIEGGSPGP